MLRFKIKLASTSHPPTHSLTHSPTRAVDSKGLRYTLQLSPLWDWISRPTAYTARPSNSLDNDNGRREPHVGRRGRIDSDSDVPFLSLEVGEDLTESRLQLPELLVDQLELLCVVCVREKEREIQGVREGEEVGEVILQAAFGNSYESSTRSACQ